MDENDSMFWARVIATIDSSPDVKLSRWETDFIAKLIDEYQGKYDRLTEKQKEKILELLGKVP